MTDLMASYAHRQRGKASYAGVLRETPKSRPAWTCVHDHLTATGAAACANAELDRRTQGENEVFWLRRCEPCDRWWGDGVSAACPVCAVPMERMKVAVLERVPVS